MSANQLLSKIKTSATAAIHDLAEQKKRAGERVYNLSVGEPILPSPPFLAEAAAAAVKEEKTRYAPIAGLPELREAAARWLNQTYGTDYAAEQTLVTCGGKFGIYLTCQTILKPGDEVLVIAPYWVSYPAMIKLAGATAKIISSSSDRGFRVSARDIAGACTAKTKLLFLNSACNPTGVVYNRGELAAILALAKEKNFLVVSDEVYSGLIYDGEYVSCGSFPEYREQALVAQSCSKNFAMTGWRVGFVFAPSSIMPALTALQSQTITGTSTISQAVAIAALSQADIFMERVRKQIKVRRDAFVSQFNKLFPRPIAPPASALYAFIPLPAFGTAVKDSETFCYRALEQCNVAMVPGKAFGVEGYARCSFGLPEQEIKEALARLAKGLAVI